MAIKVGKGKAEVTITGVLADGLEAQLREALGPVGDTIDGVAGRIQATAKADWPVKSGRSRDAITRSLRVHPDAFLVESVIYSDVPYAYYIISTKIGTKNDSLRPRSPFQELLRKPAKAATSELKTTLPEVIGRALLDKG